MMGAEYTQRMARSSAWLVPSRPALLAALTAALLCVARLSAATAPGGTATAGRIPASPDGAMSEVGTRTPSGAAAVRCLADGSGYFRARLRGALTADLDWRNAGLECEGGMRPDGHGIRVSFAGPLQSAGSIHRLRFIFGIEAAGEGRSGRTLPSNVTLILEGERRIFSTRGDNQCTVDDLRQVLLGKTAKQRDYRVAARGFCVGPATSLTGSERVLLSRFDFSGRIVVYDDSGAAQSSGDPSRETTQLYRPAICRPGTRAPLCDAADGGIAPREAGSRTAG